MSLIKFLFAGFILIVIAATPAFGEWITKDGWVDYSQHKVGNPPEVNQTDGMPDFDQKQDNWRNNANPPQWNWCGPVATANCLWWFDSKMEMVKCKSLPAGTQVRPPAVSDHYPLVRNMQAGVRDDHVPANVIPWITNLATYLPTGGVPPAGVTANDLMTMITNYLSAPEVNLWGHYAMTHVMQPTFNFIYAQTDSSQDQIVLIGFWQEDTLQHYWYRFGGHWLTVAGVNNENFIQSISFSDPADDHGEAGFAGMIWDGWLLTHTPYNTHGAGIHNDAGNASHDYYTVAASGSPGGVIALNGYGAGWTSDDWTNYQEQNTDSRWGPRYRPYQPGVPVHTEIEEIVMVCPNFDYGDLWMDYPTIDISSCGPAHPLTDKAWLGQSITAEVQPRIYNHDNSDDGVSCVHLPWRPTALCTVRVDVSCGAHYAGEALYLTAWIDGNMDGDFDDGPIAPRDDSLNYTEWVIQDVPVACNASYQFVFRKPGTGTNPTSTIMRFRLNSIPAGRFGYGGYWGGGSSNGWGTYDIDWTLGEAEDYNFPVMIPGPIHDLVIYYPFNEEPVHLYWTAPSDGMYFIYSTTNPNNHGDPPGPDWMMEGPFFYPAGPAEWISPMVMPTLMYMNYVVTYEPTAEP
jgi:hypothetical protein